MAERIIGIDFGTSTSVVRVRRYQNGNPVDIIPNAVTFNNGSPMVPTLIQKLANGAATYYGYEAEVPKRAATVYQNYKLELESPDPEKRAAARELTAEFLNYLGETYRHQSDTGFLGDTNDNVETHISYPVKWSQETRDFMLEAARAAGFPNVSGTDEAQACIQAVTEQYAELLTGKGYFQLDKPCTILLIDMGAGTTDLVLCRHTPGVNTRTEILNTWPKQSETLFGGHTVDDILYDYIVSSFPDVKAVERIPLSAFKTWKESVVSPALQRGESVDFFASLQQIEMALGIDLVFDPIDRNRFETLTSEYLTILPNMVSDILKDTNLTGNDIDLVLLTGGHSQWYFVREMLTDRLPQYGHVALDKIKADPERIVSLARPQETVALGLVYKSIPLVFSNTQSSNNETRSPIETTNTNVAENRYHEKTKDGPPIQLKTGSTPEQTIPHTKSVDTQMIEREPIQYMWKQETDEKGRILLNGSSKQLFLGDVKAKLKEFEAIIPQQKPKKDSFSETFFNSSMGLSPSDDVIYAYQTPWSSKCGFCITNHGINSFNNGWGDSITRVTWEDYLQSEATLHNDSITLEFRINELQKKRGIIKPVGGEDRGTMLIRLHEYLCEKYIIDETPAAQQLFDKVMEYTEKHNTKRELLDLVELACCIFLHEHPEYRTEKNDQLVTNLVKECGRIFFAVIYDFGSGRRALRFAISEKGLINPEKLLLAGNYLNVDSFDFLSRTNGSFQYWVPCDHGVLIQDGGRVANVNDSDAPEIMILLDAIRMICKHY